LGHWDFCIVTQADRQKIHDRAEQATEDLGLSGKSNGRDVFQALYDIQIAAVEDANARPMVPNVAGLEMSRTCLLSAEFLVESLTKPGQSDIARDENRREAAYLLKRCLDNIAFLNSVIEDESGSSAREIRNAAFVSGAEWMKGRIRASVLMDCGNDEGHSAVMAVDETDLPGEAER
jgi:hypothetical protein